MRYLLNFKTAQRKTRTTFPGFIKYYIITKTPIQMQKQKKRQSAFFSNVFKLITYQILQFRLYQMFHLEQPCDFPLALIHLAWPVFHALLPTG